MSRLLQNIKARLPELEALLRQQDSGRWEDLFYRFYHQSWKVYGIQRSTLAIVAALRALLPEVPLNPNFERILAEGTGKMFTPEANRCGTPA